MSNRTIAALLAVGLTIAAGPAAAVAFAAHNEVTTLGSTDGHCRVTIRWTGGGTSSQLYSNMSSEACYLAGQVTGWLVGDPNPM